jgi:hypothetical protein
MKYLINLNKPTGKAHLWDDGDSYCKMYLTGGMNRKKYRVYPDLQNREICLMCRNVWNSIHTYTNRSENEF